MIKRLLSVSFVCAALFAGAQTQVANPGFESWGSTYPTSWGSVDEAISSLVGPSGTIIKSTAPYAGSFAVQLEPKNNVLIGQVVPAIIVTGNFNIVISPFSISVDGRPYTDRPTDMTFYYTFSPAGGDTAGAAVWLYKWNSTTNMRDTMAYGELEITAAAGAYTMGTVNLNYYNTGTPDSIAVIFASTLTQVTVGTSMKVDGVSLNGTASGISESFMDNGIRVYPNPVRDVLNISTVKGTEVSYVVIYDMNGRELINVPVGNRSLTQVSTDNLSNGMYFYSAFDAQGRAITTDKIVVNR